MRGNQGGKLVELQPVPVLFVPPHLSLHEHSYEMADVTVCGLSPKSASIVLLYEAGDRRLKRCSRLAKKHAISSLELLAY